MSATVREIRQSAGPHSLEAEQAVLGALLTGTATCAQVVHLGADDFCVPEHRNIFAMIRSLGDSGQSHDAAMVIAELERLSKLDEAGGRALIRRLVEETATTAESFRTYLGVVLDRSDARRLLSLASEIREAVADGLPAAEVASLLEPLVSTFAASDAPPRRPLSWATLEGRSPPDRDWAVEHWLGMGHVTLLTGAGGMGKTSAAQALGSCLAIRREYLDWVPKPRRVLMWAGEDDEDELWRKQIAIAKWLNVPLAEFEDRLHLISYDGEQIELAGLVDQRRLVQTPMMTTLRDQIGDLRADVVILDNVARLYGGNENERHQVTNFIAMLTKAARPTNAAVMLLAHPGKAVGSEYSGSTAWEGAVRSRLFLGRSLPDHPQGGDEVPDDDTVRFLSRRKANYSARDWRRLQFTKGVLVPEQKPEPGMSARPSADYAQDIVRRAVRKLAEMGEHGVASSASSKYLPRLASDYKLLERLSKKEFAAAMRELQSSGMLISSVVGKYSNRSPREGLTLSDKH